MIDRISRKDILKVTSIEAGDITEHDRDEMAIPTYMHWNPLIRWLMWKRYDCLADLIDEKSAAALEFGCGIGLFLPELKKNYNNVFAVDLYPQYAKRLLKTLNVDVNFVDSTDELEENSLDLIVAADVLEHIEELEQYLDKFHAKLKPGAQFLVSGPTENILYKIGRIIAGFAGKGDYHHTDIYQLIEAIEQYGFRKERVIDLPFPGLPPLFRITEFRNPD
ncbi:MAG: methyltransferase domain-containing protein [Gammaproteobacteria bacterium]|nr:methyltransferase domain-containing protein [Gammaproteobacteria bacterium]